MILAALIASGICLFETHGPVRFEVPRSNATRGILLWSHQARLQVLFDYRVAVEFETLPVSGTLEPLAALRAMLKYTGLEVDYTNARTVAVHEPEHYCHPEWGAMAPLPPCVPRPLTVRGIRAP